MRTEDSKLEQITGEFGANNLEAAARELLKMAQVICGACSDAPPGDSGCPSVGKLDRTARMVAIAEEEIRRRRLRLQHLPPEFFGEAAWSIMLDLFISQYRGRRIATTSACIAAEVPQTTALRWLDVLEQHELIQRTGTEHDKRVRFVTLTARGYKAVTSILSSYCN